MPEHASVLIETAGAEERALARAVVYRFCGTALRYPDGPAARQAAALLDPLATAVATLEPDAAGPLSVAARRLQAAAAIPRDLEARFVALFGHGVQGDTPAYECQYGDLDQGVYKGHELADIGAFYRAYGLAPRSEVRERVDHVGLECEFLAFLVQKEAWALAIAHADLASDSVATQRKFLADHLARWVPAFAERLDTADGDYYGAVAALLRAAVELDCAALDADPGSPRLAVRPVSAEPEDCTKCPQAGDCGPLETGAPN
jgi:TorA maturation chaperone TorD